MKRSRFAHRISTAPTHNSAAPSHRSERTNGGRKGRTGASPWLSPSMSLSVPCVLMAVCSMLVPGIARNDQPPQRLDRPVHVDLQRPDRLT